MSTLSVLSPIETDFELVFKVSVLLMLIPVTLFATNVVSKMVPTK
jgi:hypothetical protein